MAKNSAAAAKAPAKASATAKRKRVPDIKPGKYADGLPFHEVQYLECKLILRPNHFTSRKSLFDFAKVMRRARGGARREVLDRRVRGFAAPDPGSPLRGHAGLPSLQQRLHPAPPHPATRTASRSATPEIVFKFRHPDMQIAAETDVRPQIFGDYRIKFKAEALPLKDALGGIRLLFSHNVEFPLLARPRERPDVARERSCASSRSFRSSRSGRTRRSSSSASTIVEEVLQDIGVLDFGEGISAKANVALWRARGDHRPLIGEFAFQFKFKKREELREEAMRKAEEFFLALQYAAKDWIALGATKTGVVYRLKGNPPNAHE